MFKDKYKSVLTQQNSTKFRADDLCGKFICEYFCWMFGDPHFFFSRSLPFLILSVILKNRKNLYVGSFNYCSLSCSQKVEFVRGYRCVRDLGAAFFKVNST